MNIEMSVADIEMLRRIMDNGIYILDRSTKIIDKNRTRTVEVPAELFPQVEAVLNSHGFKLVNRDTARLQDVTGGAVSRMLEE